MPIERRVLQVHTGEVDDFISEANSQGIGEIEELDTIPSGTFQVFSEIIPDSPDYTARDESLERLKGVRQKPTLTLPEVKSALDDIIDLLGIG